MAVVNENGDSNDPKHFIRFVTLFAVCPLYKDTLKTKIHAIIVLIALITMFCYEMYGRIKSNFNSTVKTSNRTIVISTFNTVTGFLCNIVITLPALFSNRDFEENIAKELHQIDLMLSKYPVKFHRRNRSFRMQVVFILTLFYIGLFLTDLSLWLELGDSDYQKESYYVLDRLFRYRICVVVIYLYYLIKGFLLRIISINKALVIVFKRVTILEIRNENQVLKQLENITVDVCKLHAKFAHIVKSFNGIFGWQMLAILLNYILLFLVTYEMGLRIAAQSLKNAKWQHISWFISLLIYAAITIVSVTLICNRTTLEAKRTVDLSYFYLYNLNLNRQGRRQALLVKTLTSLIRQTRNDGSVAFSAAGFFPIDYSTLYTLIKLLMSYLIVLIQFD